MGTEEVGRLDGWDGGARRDRTADLLHAMQALSQLSYGPVNRDAQFTVLKPVCQCFFQAKSPPPSTVELCLLPPLEEFQGVLDAAQGFVSAQKFQRHVDRR